MGEAAERRAALACMGLGLLLSLLPHLMAWAHFGGSLASGGPVWIADDDDLLYLTVAARAFHEHSAWLRDPVLNGGGPAIYPWLSFIPAVATARAWALGPFGVDLVWRAFSGASIGLGWYFLVRQFVARRTHAALVAMLLMADGGLLLGHPIIDHARMLVTTLRALGSHAILEGKPTLAPQWRIITPGLSLGFLLLYLGLLVRALRRPSVRRVAWAAGGFGLLFYSYFYYWTSAGLALVLLLALVKRRLRKPVFAIGAGGFFLGLPLLISSALAKSAMNAETLPRLDSFLPIDRLSELLIPRVAILLVALCLAWSVRRRRDLLALTTLAASSLLLLNEQVVTGLLISNFHWNYALGPALSVVLVLLIYDAVSRPLDRRPWLAPALFALCALHVAGGVLARAVESFHSERSARYTEAFHRYQAQRQARGAPALEAGAAIAGDPVFEVLSSIGEGERELSGYATDVSLSIGNDEWDSRIALDSLARGATDARQFESQTRTELRDMQTGPWERDPRLFEQRIAHRLSEFDKALADPRRAFTRFGIRYVALGHEVPPPAYLASGWELLQDGPTWRIWRANP